MSMISIDEEMLKIPAIVWPEPPTYRGQKRQTNGRINMPIALGDSQKLTQRSLICSPTNHTQI
jgi:hypothetical protein